MNHNLLIFSTLALLIAYVNAHARLMQPVSRGSAWRKYPNDFPYVDQDDADMCDVFNGRPKKVNVKCGICGPIYNDDVASSANIYIRHKDPKPDYNKTHYSFEKGGPYYTGKIVKTYKKGATVEALIKINAGHLGNFEFRLCNADGIENPTKECFEKYILKSSDGQSKFPQIRKRDGPEQVEDIVFDKDGNEETEIANIYRVNLPENVTCEHCIFQFRWTDTIPKQVYYGCSDIAIVDE